MANLTMKTTKMILGFCLGLFCASPCSAQIMTTVAGNGVQGFSGDGGPAAAASLSGPYGVAVDAAGNIYIADSIYNCVRKVAAGTGVISTFAGTCGSPGGYYGDGGPATQAEMKFPFNLTLDAAGNLYITEHDNHVVRKVDTAGIITTIAGDGAPCVGPSPCGDGGPATLARLHTPTGIAVDTAGNVYVADGYNHCIRKVNSAGGINTIAGDPNHFSWGNAGDGGPAQAALLHTPYGLAFDGSGNLYYVDFYFHVVRKIAAAGGQVTGASTISRVAGIYSTAPGFSGDGGPATLAKMDTPSGLTVDATGNIYISDRVNRRLRKVDTSNIISTVSGNGIGGSSGDNGPAVLAQVHDPSQLTTDACGNLYIADYGAYRVRKISGGAVPAFNPTITSATPVCAGKKISAKGLYAGTIPPDSYSWQLQSCTPAGVPTGAYDSGVLTSPGAPPATAFSFPNTANLACNQHYLITLTLKKNCPAPTTAQITKQVFVKCGPTPAISGATTICNGGSTTLCSSYQNNSQYAAQWTYQTGGIINDMQGQCITVSPTTNTTYNLSVTDNATGCTGSTSANVVVAKNNPAFTYQTNYTSPNNYFTVSATPAAPYTNGVAGFGDLWVIEQLDASGNTIPGTNTSTGTPQSPTCWWIYPSTNTFPGFDGTKSSGVNNVTCPTPSPGKFANGGRYRITHGTWNQFCPWAQASHVVTVGGNRIRGAAREEEVNAPDYRHLKPSVRPLSRFEFPAPFNWPFSFLLGQQGEDAGQCSQD